MDKFKGAFIGMLDIVKNKLRRIKDEKYHKFYPKNPKHDDVYIVEFPKSGITWLSTLIANTNLLESSEKAKATFYNIHQFIPDIHTSQELHNMPLWDFPKYRFIKSHDVYNKNYNFVIYLVRDPYRVMNSYYLFCKQLGSFSGSFDEFVKDPIFGIKAWTEHVNSWLQRGVTAQRIHFVRYEDLIAKPFEVLQKVYINLGLLVNDESIHKAISLSDMESMAKNEEFYNVNNPNNDDFTFVGKGQKTFKGNMNASVKEYIYDIIKTNRIYNMYYQEFKK
jgi:hypothetical protein